MAPCVWRYESEASPAHRPRSIVVALTSWRLRSRARCCLPTALDINALTPVRRRADGVGTPAVLYYKRGVSHGWSVCFTSTPHTCGLNGNASDTVGLTPHIRKGNHDEPGDQEAVGPPGTGVAHRGELRQRGIQFAH